MSTDVWKSLYNEVQNLGDEDELRVLEIGAGKHSMSCNEQGNLSMLPQILSFRGKFNKIFYVALEREKPLVAASVIKLQQELHFSLVDETNKVHK